MRRPGVPKISPSADAWGPIMTANLQLIHFSPHDHEASVHLLERMPEEKKDLGHLFSFCHQVAEGIQQKLLTA